MQIQNKAKSGDFCPLYNGQKSELYFRGSCFGCFVSLGDNAHNDNTHKNQNIFEKRSICIRCYSTVLVKRYYTMAIQKLESNGRARLVSN